MKKYLLISLLLLTTGCTAGDALYECQIYQEINSDPACSGLIGQRIHMCKIHDESYSPISIPEYCKTNCLQQSGYLNQYPPECVVVRVGSTEFNTGEPNAMDRTLEMPGEVYATELI